MSMGLHVSVTLVATTGLYVRIFREGNKHFRVDSLLQNSATRAIRFSLNRKRNVGIPP